MKLSFVFTLLAWTTPMHAFSPSINNRMQMIRSTTTTTTATTTTTTTCFNGPTNNSQENEQDTLNDNNNNNNSNNDILNSPAFLQRKYEVLQNDLQKAEEALLQAQERLEQGKLEWGTALADLQLEYQNIQKRMNVQSQGGDSMATVQVARKMLDVLDNFDRAFGVVQPETEEQYQIESAYKTTYEMMLQAFHDMGVEEVQTIGTEFDYQVHQAVMQKPTDDYEEGIVCEEFQKGFKCGDQLVRAAMVAVAV